MNNIQCIFSSKSRFIAHAIKVGACGVLCVAASLSYAAPVVIPIKCNGNPVGNISVDTGGGGVSGGFTSTVGGPPPTLAAAAAACGEDHFNWYQIVTADNKPPKDAGGNQIPYRLRLMLIRRPAVTATSGQINCPGTGMKPRPRREHPTTIPTCSSVRKRLPIS